MAGVLGIWLCGAVVPVSVLAATPAVPGVQKADGEIVWLDLQLGRLRLAEDRTRGPQATVEYRITEHETQVTDRADKQFLSIADLRAGQEIYLESRVSGAEQLATKITVEPMSAPLFQQAEGTIKSANANQGTFVLLENASPTSMALESSFSFDAEDIVAMESPSLQPVRLEIRPGDLVKVDYVVNSGQRIARSMMRYSAWPAPTTTTTTTTSTTTTSQ